LQPGGLALTTVPAFRLPWRNHDRLNQHRTRCTKASFHRVAEKAGVKTLAARYLFLWLFPAKLAARAKGNLLGSQPETPKPPPPGVNFLLFWIFRTEEKFSRALPLPVDSSLLILGGADPKGTLATEKSNHGTAGAVGEV